MMHSLAFLPNPVIAHFHKVDLISTLQDAPLLTAGSDWKLMTSYHFDALAGGGVNAQLQNIRQKLKIPAVCLSLKLVIWFGFVVFAGAVQGMVTGIRGLCNGLGPAMFGFIFFLFNVELLEPNQVTPDTEKVRDAVKLRLVLCYQTHQTFKCFKTFLHLSCRSLLFPVRPFCSARVQLCWLCWWPSSFPHSTHQRWRPAALKSPLNPWASSRRWVQSLWATRTTSLSYRTAVYNPHKLLS